MGKVVALQPKKGTDVAENEQNNDPLQQLQQRLGRVHFQQRLGIEIEHEAQVFGQGRTLFHIENWYSIHALIRTTLRLALLHRRGKRNARAIRIKHNTVVIPHLPKAFEGYTLLQISDLHLDMAADIPAALIEALDRIEERYDVCVLTGDFRAKTFGRYDHAIAGMAEVRPFIHAPTYAILGNHDSIKMVPELEALDMRLLLNESVTLEREGEVLHLAGVDDPHYYRADNLHKASEGWDHRQASILLAHSPEVYRHAAYADFDLMLCGHTHGGQICLPGGIALMCNADAPRRMCNGAWSYQGMQGYTSAGSGVSVVDVRLNCPAEITLHHLRSA
ncbi:MAG: metallophosphoesterase [Gammaproteobacteria bacterium]|nr:metallophosphoesterase [Gammaproteobacteria bacterium]